MSIANWVKETTATTGTGTITLGGAVDNAHTTFASQFQDGEYVHYTIEDGDDRESSSGVYSAGTLTRVIVHETLTAGVLAKQEPVALTLSGSAIIANTASRASVLSLPAAKTRQTWYLYDAFRGGQPTSSATPYVPVVPDTLYAMRYTVTRKTLFQRLGIRGNYNNAGSPLTTGGIARMGLYKEGSNGQVGELIVETTGTIDVATISVNMSATIPLTWIDPGNYFIAVLTDSDATLVAMDDQSIYSLTGIPTANGHTNYTHHAFNITPGWSAMPASLDGINANIHNPSRLNISCFGYTQI